MQWLKIKNKNKIKKQANPRNNPHINEFPYVIQTSSQMSTTCGEHHGFPWFLICFSFEGKIKQDTKLYISASSITALLLQQPYMTSKIFPDVMSFVHICM